jgi:hypothetical protein
MSNTHCSLVSSCTSQQHILECFAFTKEFQLYPVLTNFTLGTTHFQNPFKSFQIPQEIFWKQLKPSKIYIPSRFKKE